MTGCCDILFFGEIENSDRLYHCTLPVVIIIFWLNRSYIFSIILTFFYTMLAGKLLAVGGLSIILAAIEFAFTMIVFFISRFPGFSFAGMLLVLVKMIGMNLFVYRSVLPIVIFTGQHAGRFYGRLKIKRPQQKQI